MRNKLTQELAVCGFNAVASLGAEHPESINRLFLREDRLPRFTKVCKTLAERKRPYKLCENEELERICKSPHHQGIVAMIEEPELPNLTREDLALWSAEGKTGLILYSLGNDLNLGAIVRSAAFFEVHFVVLTETDAATRLTTAAYRAAEGGMEFVVFRKVRDTAGFLRDASQVLITFGADPRARQRIQDMPDIMQDKANRLKVPPRNGKRPGIALVIGNEETGLPEQVKNQCSALVRIPGTGVIESLNAAQAATLFLHQLYEFL
ncbi:MAG: RNA methyltransferase [Spirochaetaceae bacterium]|jgi:TrmH RNA methyltransferase|nr:RNA methyltransferase [Spirochaetaceae bacterium]